MKPLIVLRYPCPECGAAAETFQLHHRSEQLKTRKRTWAVLECPNRHEILKEECNMTTK